MFQPYLHARAISSLFRVPPKLYRRLERDLPTVAPELLQQVDDTGRRGASIWQKILCSLRRLGDGSSFQSLDDQARMSIESQRQAFHSFCTPMRKCYGDEFLNRPPTLSELRAIEQEYAESLFPGCIGSLDCMNVPWKNCPKAWKGQYQNPKNGKIATVQVEAMCDSDLYCWHVFCGRPGTNNDITVAEASPLVLGILSGRRQMKLQGGYNIAGVQRDWHLYFSTDGIYPPWSIFLKPNHAPVTSKERAMTKAKESRRKEVERFFCVLQGRFKILRNGFHGWSDEELIDVVYTCVILHNMIVRLRVGGELEDEIDENGNALRPNEVIEEFYYHVDERDFNSGRNGENEIELNSDSSWLHHVLGVNDDIRDRTAHFQLKTAFEDHIWAHTGELSL